MFATTSVPLLILGSVLLVSLLSLVGIFFLSLQTERLKKALPLLVSFSTGALIGNVFLHLLPEIIRSSPDLSRGLLMIVGGILLSFVVERFIHFRHCHTLDCAGHVEPVGPLMLIGDSVHNMLDGILIATSFLVSVPIGIATTTAVILHEIPQEFGDFAVLLHSGYSKNRALFLNFLSALTAFVGAALVLLLSEMSQGIELLILPLAAGNFLYIAGSDLIPELHKETRFRQSVEQFLCMVAGISVMYVL